MSHANAAIIGGGLCGNLLAIALARRGLSVEVFEKRSYEHSRSPDGGRSINLALAARGIAALERFDALAAVAPLMLPMRGRMIHEADAHARFAPYGAAGECIYSVSRAALNRTLGEMAARKYAVRFHYGCECTGLDPRTLEPIVSADGRSRRLDAEVVFAADGAGSVVRQALADTGTISSEESLLDHGYKELTIPPSTQTDAAAFALDPEALHIWPRGEFMLIALPNTDRSFTATLFLARQGNPSFASVDASNVERFFAAEFTDALPLLERLAAEFADNAVGVMGTVRCTSWHAKHCLLIGDAAHAIVPFHGQGMNAAFEDIAELDALIDDCPRAAAGWERLFEEFERTRIARTNAIADMALENYREMRDSVRDPAFTLQRELALELERRFPDRFASRYSMVMFRPELSYTQAQDRGSRQSGILRELTRDAASLDDVDFERAAGLLAQLPQLE
ncbi:MAG TPA: NAD(P)/FAD-dependent oxidoreductase [Gammaproteobacteria bacterium]|nr:NAD(P)/FAD-dependent oxidoreductase [Gammaproteobacteria bacterium]